MPSACPSVTLDLEPARVVTFDFGTLAAIEAGCGCNLFDVVDRIMDLAPKIKAGDDGPTPAESDAVIKRFSIDFAVKFVAGCLKTSPESLSDFIPLEQFLPAFNVLLPQFAAAVNALAGEKDEVAKGNSPSPQAASAA